MEEQKLVEKYKDIPDTEFVPIECLGDDFRGLYEINKLGHIKNLSSNNIRTEYESKGKKYPVVTFNTKKEGGGYIKKTCLLHVILAKTFLENPNEYTSVDHCDKNPRNYSLSNLRWISVSDNNRNREYKGKNICYAKLDENGEEIERYHLRDLDEKEKNLISGCISLGRRCRGYYWKRIYPETEEYINKYGAPNPDEWKICIRDDRYECNPCGLIRIRWSGRITPGSNMNGYWAINRTEGGMYFSHRLIAETLILGRLLKDEEVVDHISTDKMDNRICNLRVCKNQTENLNNPNTLAKRYKPLLQYSMEGKFIKEYESVKEASNVFSPNCSNTNFTRMKISFGYLWCYKGDESTIEERVNSFIFKYDDLFNLVKVYPTIHASSVDENSANIVSITKYIDTGKLAPDGHYYYHGPHKFTDDEQK